MANLCCRTWSAPERETADTPNEIARMPNERDFLRPYWTARRFRHRIKRFHHLCLFLFSKPSLPVSTQSGAQASLRSVPTWAKVVRRSNEFNSHRQIRESNFFLLEQQKRRSNRIVSSCTRKWYVSDVEFLSQNGFGIPHTDEVRGKIAERLTTLSALLESNKRRKCSRVMLNTPLQSMLTLGQRSMHRVGGCFSTGRYTLIAICKKAVETRGGLCQKCVTSRPTKSSKSTRHPP